MFKPATTPFLLALFAAVAALLAAWFAPLPRLVLSAEEKAGERMPQNRAAVESARADFEAMQNSYKSYIASHDVGAALTALEAAAQVNAPRDAVERAIRPVLDYLSQLRVYAVAGDEYFDTLHHYDDELMAWTRSLGTASEALRPDTWPIVEYLKLYPPPTGEASGYSSISLKEVDAISASLQSNVTAAQGNPDATPSSVAKTGVADDVAAIREAGRSIEYRENLHDAYHEFLTNYDAKVQAIVTNSNGGNLTSNRVTFATGINLLVGVVTLVGLATLFLPRRLSRPEASE
jgi:hypothetical protein